MRPKHSLLAVAATLATTLPLVSSAALPGAAGSPSGASSAQSALSSRLADRYASFAGSQANALALVDGLRSGTSIILDSTSAAGTQTTIAPATRAMGFGEVNITLALAQAELTKLGITDPTPQQIQAALDGGALTTSTGSETLTGILSMRQSGQGWGQIASNLGVNLGSVVSASETPHAHAGIDNAIAARANAKGSVVTAAADAHASMHLAAHGPVNLPPRPDIPAIVRPNLPVRVGGPGGWR